VSRSVHNADMDNYTEGDLSQPPVPTDASTDLTAQPPPQAAAEVRDVSPLLLTPVQPKLRPTVTIICTVLFLLAIQARILTTWISDRAKFLDSPEEFLEHVFGRNLDLEEYAEHRSDFEKLIDLLQGYKPGDLLDEAISAYSDFLSKCNSDWARLRRTLAILYA